MTNKADRALLDAALADDQWRALDSDLKREAAVVLGKARRWRRLRSRIVQGLSLAVLLGAIGWRIQTQPAATIAKMQMPARSVSAPQKSEFISEEQMLAMFPPGSCVVAQVNGEEALVFFDTQQAKEGFIIADSSQARR